jgi:hypothetical protein
VRLLLDEMLSAVIAEQLRGRDHDVVAVDERPELRGLSDPDLFEHAQRAQRAIVTYNREDFLALDRLYRAEGRDHHGVVILHPRRFPQTGRTVGGLIASLEAFLTAGAPYRGFVHWLQ